MKRIGGINAFTALWLLLATLLASSCQSGEDYVNALPKDAAAVVSIDLKSMAQKSGLQGDKSEKTLDKIGNLLKGMTGAPEGLIDRIVKKPENSGLKLSCKVYVFVEPGGNTAGLLARVSSARKLKGLIKELWNGSEGDVLKEEGGCSYFVAGSSIVAYTDKAFLILGNLKSGDGDDLKHTAQMMLRQKEADGYVSTPDFKEMNQTERDVVSFFSMAALPREYTTVATIGMSSDINLSDIKALVTLSFDNGKVDIDVKNRTTDKTVLEIQKKQQQASRKLKGTYLNRFSQNVLLWTGFGIDGKAWLDVLKENPSVRQGLESSMIPVDFDAIFSALEGDVTIAIPNLPATSFIVMAEVNNDAFLSTFEELKPLLAMTSGRMTLQNDGPKGYCFRSVTSDMIGVKNLYFGVKGGCFYITVDRNLLELPMGRTATDASWSKDVAGKTLFFELNAETLSSLMGGLVPGLQLFDGVKGYSDNGDELHMYIELKDKEHNVLEQLAGLIQ